VSDDLTPQLSAALAPVVPHRAAAVLAGACARSPMLAHGDADVAGRITTGELAQLAAAIPVGDVWQGSAPVGGERRPVIAIAAVAGGNGSLLVLVRESSAPLEDTALRILKGVWALVAATLDQRLEDAEPVDLAASRHAASERARVTAELADAHGATLSALLGTLRARDLDDGAARRAATDLAASALVELRATGERERDLSDEPAEQAFALLRDELRPLVRYGSTGIELAGPGSDGRLPSTVAQAGRAIVRGAVLTMLEQEDVRRIRVGWELGEEELRVSVRDDGPGELARQGLAMHGLADRARALDGDLEIDSVPGWGTHVQARLPLGPALPGRPAGPLAALNPRELEVLEHLARGRRNRQIAEELSISENTVKFHVANVLSKLGAGSRGEAGAIARDAGLGAPTPA
jgi:DNA-binding CsgD family transcriptional regulator